MSAKKVFISFDIQDRDVKQGIVAQAADARSPFEFLDNSIQEPIDSRWVAEAKRLIGLSDFVLVLCGDQTHQATGVETELRIAKELHKPYALVQATRQSTPTRPRSASPTEPIHSSRWPTIAALLRGERPPTS